MLKPEIILNLWYLQDTNDVIYSLRARAYIGIGTDEEKLTLLRQFAQTDYLIATPFPVPERFHFQTVHLTDTFNGISEPTKKLPVTHKLIIDPLEPSTALFEDVIKKLVSEFPAQTRLEIPKSPLVCVTPLMTNEDGDIVPFFTGTKRL